MFQSGCVMRPEVVLDVATAHVAVRRTLSANPSLYSHIGEVHHTPFGMEYLVEDGRLGWSKIRRSQCYVVS